MEGSGAPGEEPLVSDTQASVSQQPNAIAKSQLWPGIALAGLLCVQDAGNNHFIGLSDGQTQQEKCALFWERGWRRTGGIDDRFRKHDLRGKIERTGFV